MVADGGGREREPPDVVNASRYMCCWEEKGRREEMKIRGWGSLGTPRVFRPANHCLRYCLGFGSAYRRPPREAVAAAAAVFFLRKISQSSVAANNSSRNFCTEDSSRIFLREIYFGEILAKWPSSRDFVVILFFADSKLEDGVALC